MIEENNVKRKIIDFINTRPGFLTLLLLCYWAKTIFVGYVDFNLKFSDPYQHFIMWLSPIGMTLIILSIGLYLSRPLLSYIGILVLDIVSTILLYSNVIYNRQFSDYVTFNTMLSSSKVSKGLGMSALSLVHVTDVLIWLDLIVIVVLLFMKKIKIDQKSYGIMKPFAITSIGFLILGLNVTLAETARPRIFVNTYDRSYGVKYLGVNTFLLSDAAKTIHANTGKTSANSEEINEILSFTQNNYAKPNPAYFGKAKGKNVIVIHLESFQQFLLNFKVNGQEVTPFLNSLLKDDNTLSFSNFYHQVGLGRTSDAETMLETGAFGLSDGSVLTTLGSDNTFQAAPAILRQNGGYTSAVFHGNAGTFWNRNVVYKNFGYNYFFDSSYYTDGRDDSIGYGLKDKLLFAEGVKYLEQMQQPFYTKFLTVTNHTPYPLDEQNSDFKTSDTSSDTVNKYFVTAHYLDEALREFFDYLKKSGLYDKSLIVMYGDHYGLSNPDNLVVAPLLGKDPEDWTDFDTAQMQKVPFIMHMPGLKGGVNTTYGGEIDVLPTIMHLVGIDSPNYVMFGTDLLSKEHNQTIAFRNQDFVTPKYTVVGGNGADSEVYENSTGSLLSDLTPAQKKEINAGQKYTKQSLSFSDTLNNKNLLKLYTPAGFMPTDPSAFDYRNEYQQMLNVRDELGSLSTSVYSEHKGTTTKFYKTDAPELEGHEDYITKVPEKTK